MPAQPKPSSSGAFSALGVKGFSRMDSLNSAPPYFSSMPLKIDPTAALCISPEPWVKFNALVHLAGRDPREPDMLKEREDMLAHRLFKLTLTEAAEWPEPPLFRHNNAKHPTHKLAFLADWGVKIGDPGIVETVKKITEMQSIEGPHKSVLELPAKGGGEEERVEGWLLCDSPTLLYALISFGASGKQIDAAAEYLAGLVDENGWRCRGGVKFRGPGRKTDFCPYANLITLKALSLTRWAGSDEVRLGLEAQLGHLEERAKHYLFGVGTGFAKLKYPYVWYDCLHVAEVLSRYPEAREDPRFTRLWEGITAKQGPDGGFTPESVYLSWRDWSFAQKTYPSPTLTYRAAIIASRLS